MLTWKRLQKGIRTLWINLETASIAAARARNRAGEGLQHAASGNEYGAKAESTMAEGAALFRWNGAELGAHLRKDLDDLPHGSARL